MKIALYHPWIYLKGGIERTIVEILSRSRHDWTVYTNHFDAAATFPELADEPIIELPRVPVRRTAGAVGRAATRMLTQRWDMSPYDALVVSSEGLGDLMALRTPRARVVCLCFTPLKVLHDPHARARLDERGLPLAVRAGLGVFGAIDRLAWRRFEHVFCISEEVRRRVVRARLVDPAIVEVARPGVDVARMTPVPDMEPYFLAPGRLMWEKNLELAIDAFARFRAHADGTRFRLRIAGMVDAKSAEYVRDLQERAAGVGGIDFTFNPTDEELFDLYRRSQAVLFTALNEDWGLVPLEAMAFARPVVAVDRGGPRETVDDGVTGFLRTPNAAAFAGAMAALADEGIARRMGAAGRDRARLFDAGAFVVQIDDYFEDPARERESALIAAAGLGGHDAYRV